MNVNLTSSLLAGLGMDESTLEWWREQSAEAQASVSDLGHSLVEVLQAFQEWWEAIDNDSATRIEGLWSHGAASDVPWLESSLRACGMETPWGHRMPRDTRTLFWLAGEQGWTQPERGPGVSHDALYDCQEQVRQVHSAYAHIAAQAGRERTRQTL